MQPGVPAAFAFLRFLIIARTASATHTASSTTAIMFAVIATPPVTNPAPSECPAHRKSVCRLYTQIPSGPYAAALPRFKEFLSAYGSCLNNIYRMISVNAIANTVPTPKAPAENNIPY